MKKNDNNHDNRKAARVQKTPAPAAAADDVIREGTVRLHDELSEFVAEHTYQGPGIMPAVGLDAADTLTDRQISDMRLTVCRKLRELLPTSNRDALLRKVKCFGWMPVLMTWLQDHDHPAVQVEALLAVACVTEVCATAPSRGGVGGASPSSSPLQDAAANGYPPTSTAQPPSWATAAAPPAPGSVPFPPLSFSEPLRMDALHAFDEFMTAQLQQSDSSRAKDRNKKNKSTATSSSSSYPSGNTNNNALPYWTNGDPGKVINFTSLAPPPGGPHSSVAGSGTTTATTTTTQFMPPPTPVNSGTFPQQLTAATQHLLLRHADAIPTLISLLSSSQAEVYEQACWILGSIAAGDGSRGSGGSSSNTGGGSGGGSGSGGGLAGDRQEKSVSARDVILAAGIMNQLIACLQAHPTNLSLQRIGSWTLSNLVDGIFQSSGGSKNAGGGGGGKTDRGGDYSSADEIDMEALLPVLRRLLHMTDSEVLSYICWALSHLCDGPSSHIAAVVTSTDPKQPAGGLVPRLVELLVHPSWRVTKPALRTIGNIVCAECSDDGNGVCADYTDVILECMAVPQLKELITHNNREIQKEACWTLSNIAAGTVDQIQSVIDSGSIPPLVRLVKDKKTDQEVRSEACWVVLNATSCGSDSQIEVLVEEGCVSVLGVLLSEASMVMMALEGLERVLQVEETRELIRREQIENGDIEDDEETRTPTLVDAALFEKARESHNSSAVTKRADRIWKQHFVSCALCKKSFSKHRVEDASFCEECKCHVCSNCNCKIYHLDYQEELWADTEAKSEAKKNAKKSKNKKKKAKLKEKKAKQQQDQVETTSADVTKEAKPSNDAPAKRGSEVSEPSSETAEEKSKETSQQKGAFDRSPSPSAADDDADDEDDLQTNQIDFVLYLQQTGSIIALSKLMDALECDDYDEDELDEYERKMIREQQLMRSGQQQQHQATN